HDVLHLALAPGVTSRRGEQPRRILLNQRLEGGGLPLQDRGNQVRVRFPLIHAAVLELHICCSKKQMRNQGTGRPLTATLSCRRPTPKLEAQTAGSCFLLL